MTMTDRGRVSTLAHLAKLRGREAMRRNADADLSSARISRSLEAFEAELAHGVVENPATPLGQDEADVLMRRGRDALEKMAAEGHRARLDGVERGLLEAIVILDGSRPSLLVQDGFVEPSDPRIGDWQDELTGHETAIRRAIASTGRVLVNGDISQTGVYGTVWMVAPGLAATAQHVANLLFVRHGDQWIIPFGRLVEVDFALEAGRPQRPDERVRVIGVERASPDAARIGRAVDLANLDVAILRLDAEGPPAPPPLVLAETLDQGAPVPQIHVVGHPARPALEAGAGPARGDAEHLTMQALTLIFGDTFGVKRWAPGRVVIGPGVLAGDVNLQVMTHDASTLGGSSGSPIFDLTRHPERVVGLHYAGEFKKENYAHPTNRIRPQLDLPGATFA